MRDAAFITRIANYIVDKSEAGWSLDDILSSIRSERSEVTLAEVKAAVAEAFHDDTCGGAVKRLGTDAFDAALNEVVAEVKAAAEVKGGTGAATQRGVS